MTTDPDSSDSDDPRVMELARAYLADCEAGRVPDRKGYLARYPDIANEVEECLDGIDLAHAAGRTMRTQAAPSQPDFPKEPLGDFRIVREIGRGGMGIVYEAVQLSLGRRVALKVLPFASALNSRQLQRFQTEAHAAAQLHHTNIVPVYAVGCERGVHFYAMQVIDGRPLDQVIHELREGTAPANAPPTIDKNAAPTKSTDSRSKSSRVSAIRSNALLGSQPTSSRTGRVEEAHRNAAAIGMQVAEALEYAHEAGVVHRDVKPANLLLDAKGNAWVTDFGLARVNADTGITQTGDIFGTLRYMSPEQAAGRRLEVDHRADVYSLGATLYELVCLEPAFPGQDKQRVLQQILNEEPKHPRLIDRSIPIELETIILKAMAKLPVERYQTAGEMSADLRRFLEHRPILARRPSVWDHGRKWLRRHPAILWAGVAVLIVAVIALGTSTALVTHEQMLTKGALDREKQRAKEAEERFALARRSADELIQIAEDELGYYPPLETLRRRLLETALAYYQEFIDLRRDDPAAQTDLALTRDRVKRILDDLTVLQGDRAYFLLDDPAAHEELKLSEMQKTAVVASMRELNNRQEELFRNFRSLSSDQRQKRFLELARTREAALAEILTDGQMHRLKQIKLQVLGPRAFQNTEVVAALKITSEQKEKIRDIEEKANLAGHFGFGGMREGRGKEGPGLMDDRVPRMDKGGLPRDARPPEDKGPGWFPKEGRPPEEKGLPKGPGDRGPGDRGPGGRGPDEGFGPPPGGPRGGPFTPMEFTRPIVEQVVAILTPEQKVMWRELTGEPLKFSPKFFRGGPNRNGPNRTGGGQQKGFLESERKGPG